jgi:transketolase
MDYLATQGKLKLKILELHFLANSGHIGSSLSCIDIMIAVYLNKNESDTFILSKGHAATALYSVLHERGELTSEELTTFYKNGTNLPAHPAPLKFKSVIFATGSLGHGLPLGTGIAKAKKLKKEQGISFVLLSDGETNEGTTWEAAHFAVAHRLDNLIAIVDKNKLQGFGFTENVLGDTANEKVWKEIGFETASIDGHDIAGIQRIVAAFAANPSGKPRVIIADTVKGKDVPHMENKLEWHYLPMTQAMYTTAVDRIKSEYNLQ